MTFDVNLQVKEENVETEVNEVQEVREVKEATEVLLVKGESEVLEGFKEKLDQWD